jgi:histidinol-phosphate aminotransferase
MSQPAGHDLDHHGDAEPGADLNLAVNVRLPQPPAWLLARLQAAMTGLAAYPRQDAALAAVAARHGRDASHLLLTNGAAEAFTLLALALSPARAVCVHPSFTEPEAALRAAGHAVTRVVLPPPFELAPALVPAEADLVVIGNPTNPTGRLHPVSVLEQLARPGRTLVVDEAFADAVPGEPTTLSGRPDLPGVVVVRSLTKTWGLAGLRVGYLLGPPQLVRALQRTQPLWPVNALALEALIACSEPAAVAVWVVAVAVWRFGKIESRWALSLDPPPEQGIAGCVPRRWATGRPGRFAGDGKRPGKPLTGSSPGCRARSPGHSRGLRCSQCRSYRWSRW